MPWKETMAVKERVKFMMEWEKRWNGVRGSWTSPCSAASSEWAGKSGTNGFRGIAKPRTTWARPRNGRDGRIRRQRRCPASSRTRSWNFKSCTQRGDRRKFTRGRCTTARTLRCRHRAPSVRFCAAGGSRRAVRDVRARQRQPASPSRTSISGRPWGHARLWFGVSGV